MSSRHSNNDTNEQLVYRYIDALERGDFETISLVLELAERSPTLESMLLEINEAMAEEPTLDLPLSQTPTTVANTTETHPTHTLLSPALDEPVSAHPPTHPNHRRPDSTPSNTPKAHTPRVFPIAMFVGSLGFCALIFAAGQQLLTFPLPFMPKTGTTRPIKKQPGHKVLASSADKCLSPETDQPTQRNWVDAIHRAPHHLTPFLEGKGGLREDSIALLQNQKLNVAVSRVHTLDNLSPAHRIIRARLYLRMARFHRKNYKLALSFHHEVYQRRLRRSKELQLGRQFHYYWGRLLCLQGKRAQAVDALKKAASPGSTPQRDRARAWLLVCAAKPERAHQLSLSLEKLTFKNDPDGWAEWILLHHLFRLKTTRTPALRSQRAQLYAKVWKKEAARWPASMLRTPIEKEAIQEQGIQTELQYFDPAIFAMMADDYAQRALKALSNTPNSDLYAPFYRAEAHALLGNKEKASAMRRTFISHPPRKLSWPYLLFSHRLSPRSLRHEACYHRALDKAHTAPQLAQALLKQLSRQGRAAKTLAGLGYLQLKTHQRRSFAWLRDNVEYAQRREKSLKRRYLNAAQRPNQPGASIIVQLRLHRYLVRSFYLWGSMGAILAKENVRATWWMERLHRKDSPYKITGENEPFQFAWTVNAYAHAGRLNVAAQFFARNLKSFPSLHQLWSLIKLWQIFEGMNGVPLVKTG